MPDAIPDGVVLPDPSNSLEFDDELVVVPVDYDDIPDEPEGE